MTELNVKLNVSEICRINKLKQFVKMVIKQSLLVNVVMFDLLVKQHDRSAEKNTSGNDEFIPLTLLA